MGFQRQKSFNWLGVNHQKYGFKLLIVESSGIWMCLKLGYTPQIDSCLINSELRVPDSQTTQNPIFWWLIPMVCVVKMGDGQNWTPQRLDGQCWRWPKSIKILTCTHLIRTQTATWKVLLNPKLDSDMIDFDWLGFASTGAGCAQRIPDILSSSKAASRLYYFELLKAKRWPCSSIRCVWEWAAPQMAI